SPPGDGFAKEPAAGPLPSLLQAEFRPTTPLALPNQPARAAHSGRKGGWTSPPVPPRGRLDTIGPLWYLRPLSKIQPVVPEGGTGHARRAALPGLPVHLSPGLPVYLPLPGGPPGGGRCR